jgi:hypothetical protein
LKTEGLLVWNSVGPFFLNSFVDVEA